jgi:hypothetical protein
MEIWSRLTPHQAYSRYRVSKDAAEAKGNAFYGMKHQVENVPYDTPWPFWALVKCSEVPDSVMLSICTIESEALEFEGFDPLNDRGGYLWLRKQELLTFAELIKEHAAQMELSEIGGRDSTFRKLSSVEAGQFRLRPDWFDEIDFYLKVREGLDGEEKDKLETIITFSPKGKFTRHLTFGIMQFPSNSLRFPSFNMLDDSLSKIYLDKVGMEDLASLLQEQYQKHTWK